MHALLCEQIIIITSIKQKRVSIINLSSLFLSSSPSFLSPFLFQKLIKYSGTCENNLPFYEVVRMIYLIILLPPRLDFVIEPQNRMNERRFKSEWHIRTVRWPPNYYKVMLLSCILKSVRHHRETQGKFAKCLLERLEGIYKNND